MNILPKKSWHVRNKNNIERVRRDEEKAAEEEKERQRRVAIAESEARTELLRQKSRSHCDTDVEVHPSSNSQQQHINFFEEHERGEKLGGHNAEREEEKRLEKEKHEKALGLLKYLGQGSIELEAEKPWYFKAPEKRRHSSDDSNITDKRNKLNKRCYRKLFRACQCNILEDYGIFSPSSQHVHFGTEGNVSNFGSNGRYSVQRAIPFRDEVDSKKKRSADPMCSMNAYVDQSIKVRRLKHGSSDEHSHHKHAHHKSDLEKKKSRSIDELRAERLRREQFERHRSEQLLGRMHGGGSTAVSTPDPVADDRQRRYNSQFNPDIARRPRPNDSLT